MRRTRRSRQLDGLLARSGCALVVPSQPLHRGKLGQNPGLYEAVTDVMAERQGLP
jgi:hypothetical protein